MSNDAVALATKISNLPQSPGVYLMKNSAAEIIYVGKAKLLSNRVRTYFQGASATDRRIYELVHRIADFEWIVTLSETEALILEDQLIKLHKPKYNVRLKDNKTYPYIKLSFEKYPRVYLTRAVERDKSSYFGPYSSVMDARLTLNVIHQYFPIRTSKMDLDDGKTYRPCLNFHLKRCLAPCRGNITVEEYAAVITRIKKLLNGEYKGLLADLSADMITKSEREDFEAAAKVRDQIKAVKQTLEKKPRVKSNKIEADVIAIDRKDGFIGAQVLFIRKGVIVGSDFELIKGQDFQSDEEIIRSLFSRLYLGTENPPPSLIILPEVTAELAMLESYIAKQHEQTIKILPPTLREHQLLFKTATNNAVANLKLHLSTEAANDKIINQCQHDLRLKNTPKRVECYDISNLMGTNMVASLVVFEDNMPLKKDYKRYKIKTVEGIDDFAAMAEVISRRIKRGLSSEWPFPDLIIIDGGLGQLSAAYNQITELISGVPPFDIIGLAKGRSVKKRVLKGTQIETNNDFEYVVKHDEDEPINLEQNSITLHYLQRVRDEAHRFAKAYHVLLRDKQMKKSALDQIPGIGHVKKRSLLRAVGSITNLKEASIETLSNQGGLNSKDAKSVFDFFHSTK